MTTRYLVTQNEMEDYNKKLLELIDMMEYRIETLEKIALDLEYQIKCL